MSGIVCVLLILPQGMGIGVQGLFQVIGQVSSDISINKQI